MIVVLFRHGPAGTRDAERWPDDRRRPLSERGVIRTRAAAGGLTRCVEGTPRILTSPLVRCASTADLLRETFGLADAPETLAALAPGGAARDTLRRLTELRDEDLVILVGHEPDLGSFAGVLVFGAPTALPLKKAGACAVRFDGAPKAGGGVLQWLLPPRALRALGRKKSRA